MSKLRNAALLVAIVGCLSVSVGVGAASGVQPTSGTPATAHAAGVGNDAKFVLHAGLAFGAFHHFIWKPFKAGDLTPSFTHTIKIGEAALAALFTYHEVKLAAADAQQIKALKPLVVPLTALSAKLSSLGGLIKGHDTSTITSLNGTIGSVESSASGAGASIKEQIPGVSQLG